MTAVRKMVGWQCDNPFKCYKNVHLGKDDLKLGNLSDFKEPF